MRFCDIQNYQVQNKSYSCRASARQLTNLDIPVSYEISESRASLSPELYVVEISICVCGFVEMTDFRGTGFFFSTNTGELDITNFGTYFVFRVLEWRRFENKIGRE